MPNTYSFIPAIATTQADHSRTFYEFAGAAGTLQGPNGALNGANLANVSRQNDFNLANHLHRDQLLQRSKFSCVAELKLF